MISRSFAMNDMPVRIGRVRPVDDPIERLARAEPSAPRRLDQLRAIQLDVPFGRELRDHEIAVVVVDEIAVAVLHHKGGAPSCLGGHLGAHPEAIAGPRVQPTQLAVAADAIGVVTDESAAW